MKYVFIIISSFFLFLGCKENSVVKKRIGNNIVEGKFISDSLIEGRANYYSSEGTLEAYYTFKGGVKDGNAVTFYENGKIKDSMTYTNNLLNGQAYKFDGKGQMLFTIMYYYGLDVGDHSFFKNGIVNEYHFDNFDQKELVSCKYDSLGSCDSLVFNASPFIKNGLIEKQTPAIKMFLYFPHPPDFDVIYTMGLIEKSQKQHDKVVLNSNRLFLDTTLIIPKNNLNYFLSIAYKSRSNDSLVNVYFKAF